MQAGRWSSNHRSLTVYLAPAPHYVALLIFIIIINIIIIVIIIRIIIVIIMSIILIFMKMDDNRPSIITRGLPVRTKSIVIIKPWVKVLVTAVGWANLVLPGFVRAPKDPVIPLCHFERQFAQKEMWVYRIRDIHVTQGWVLPLLQYYIFFYTLLSTLFLGLYS